MQAEVVIERTPGAGHLRSGDVLKQLCLKSTEGGFADLYKAVYDSRDYAVKVVRGRHEETRQKAMDEYTRMLEVSACEQIPSVYGFGTFCVDEVESPAIVMEWIDGTNLEEIKKSGLLSRNGEENGQMDAISAARIALEIACAFEWLGSKPGKSHRDPSPRNIMITKDSYHEGGLKRDIRVFLIDFGQAAEVGGRVTPEGSEHRRLTTIPYGPPENYGGENYVLNHQPPSDIWSLGAVIACMLAPGPYWPKNLKNLDGATSLSQRDMERIVQAKAVGIDLLDTIGKTKANATYAELTLHEIVAKCTKVALDDRPSAGEVVAMLEEMIEQSACHPNTESASAIADIDAAPALRTPQGADAANCTQAESPDSGGPKEAHDKSCEEAETRAIAQISKLNSEKQLCEPSHRRHQEDESFATNIKGVFQSLTPSEQKDGDRLAYTTSDYSESHVVNMSQEAPMDMLLAAADVLYQDNTNEAALYLYKKSRAIQGYRGPLAQCLDYLELTAQNSEHTTLGNSTKIANALGFYETMTVEKSAEEKREEYCLELLHRLTANRFCGDKDNTAVFFEQYLSYVEGALPRIPDSEDKGRIYLRLGMVYDKKSQSHNPDAKPRKKARKYFKQGRCLAPTEYGLAAAKEFSSLLSRKYITLQDETKWLVLSTSTTPDSHPLIHSYSFAIAIDKDFRIVKPVEPRVFRIYEKNGQESFYSVTEEHEIMRAMDYLTPSVYFEEPTGIKAALSSKLNLTLRGWGWEYGSF